MAELKRRGDVAELKVAVDARARGYRVAFPYGEDCDYDLVVDRAGSLERVQVKATASDGRVIQVRCRSQSLTSGKVRATKRYTARTIDWLAVYDETTDRCYYVPASELGDAGRSLLHLRLEPGRNGQQAKVRRASDYLSF